MDSPTWTVLEAPPRALISRRDSPEILRAQGEAEIWASKDMQQKNNFYFFSDDDFFLTEI